MLETQGLVEVAVLSLLVVSRFRKTIARPWPDSLCHDSGWRNLLVYLVSDNNDGMLDPPLFTNGEIYQFGMIPADATTQLRLHFPRHVFWGFDSFNAMARESRDLQDNCWHAESCESQLSQGMSSSQKPVDLVPGFSNISPKTAEAMRMYPALYVDIDVDVYTSVRDALEFMFGSRLIRPGTLIGYDDWWVHTCSRGADFLHPLNSSEGRAHKEITQKYSVRFRCIAGPCRWRDDDALSCWGPIFIVEAVGGAIKPYHGFEMTSRQVQAWKDLNDDCRMIWKEGAGR